jgi:proteasome lid subunit RPN8/RPN11
VSTLRLGLQVRAVIGAHGAGVYPEECCGALLGRGGVVHEAWPLPNATEEGPRRRFLVNADDYRSAEARASATGLDLLGFYHSHPDHPARPSQYDLEHAWPTFSYVIISVTGGRAGAVTSWRLADDRSAFTQEALTI